MATTTMSSRGQIVIPKHLREKLRLRQGARLEITDQREALILRPARSAPPKGWRAWRGRLRGTSALVEHLAEHRRDANR